jgi:glycosyltransferase involved in cell wall biosynthesis
MNSIVNLVLGTISKYLNYFYFIIKYQVNIRLFRDADLATIASSSLFDRKWYLLNNEDVKKAKVNPIKHYCKQGWKEGRNPSQLFDGNSYLLLNPDVEKADINPLLHYEKIGRSEERIFHNTSGHSLPNRMDTFVPLLRDEPFPLVPVNIIAFYMLQFNEIPENNEFSGKGLTGWSGVKKSRPLFKGHYQPHVPGELGYYNLPDSKTLKRQIELAQLYGIGGFCFYFNRLDGKTLCEAPILNYLNDSFLNFPFCLCWDNGNLTSNPEGFDSGLRGAQTPVSGDDDLVLIANVSKYFQDSRYIRINGKPLLLIFQPGLLPDPMLTAKRWREWLRAKNLGEIYLAYVQSSSVYDDPSFFGFDAAIEFPPDKSKDSRIVHDVKSVEGRKNLNIFNMESVIEKSRKIKNTDYKLFRGLCPSWDNTPEKKASGSIVVNNTPEFFEEWVSYAITDTIDKSEFDLTERLIFVNAWNGWAQGAHLEPDKKYGYAWLQAIRNALNPFSQVVSLNNGENKKTVLFDLLFCQGSFHGGGEYGKAVFRELVDKVISRSDYVIYVALSRKLEIDESILSLCNNNSDHIKLLYVNNLSDIRKLVNTNLFDAFFAPALVVYSQGYKYLKSAGKELGFHCSKTRIIGTVHDIRDFEMAVDYYKIYNFRKSIGCEFENKLSSQKLKENMKSFGDYADSLRKMYQKIVNDDAVTNIITVSDYSKKSIEENLQFEGHSKLSVLYSCMKHRYSPVPFSKNGHDFESIKYILSINLSRVEKNGTAIAKAIDELFSENRLPGNYYAVLTGIESLTQLDVEIKNKDRYILLGVLSPESLEYLYSKAVCLVYASLSEGFGYPPIEAMSYNVPSVVSEISAIPEICGDAAIYCDPYDVTSVKEAIVEIINNPPSKEVLRNRYAYITSRQVDDLNKLGEIILNINQ